MPETFLYCHISWNRLMFLRGAYTDFNIRTYTLQEHQTILTNATISEDYDMVV